MAATVLEAASLIRFANETHKEYALRKYEHVYQSAYASGSAARRDAIVKYLREEIERWNSNHGYIAPGKIHIGAHALEVAIERIEKE